MIHHASSNIFAFPLFKALENNSTEYFVNLPSYVRFVPKFNF